MARSIREYLEAINANFREAAEGGFVSIPDAADPGECFERYDLAAASEANLETLSKRLPGCGDLSQMPKDCLIALAADKSGHWAAWMREDAPADHPDLKDIRRILEDGVVLDESLYAEKLRGQFDNDAEYAEWDARQSGDREKMAELQKKEAAESVAYWLNEAAKGEKINPDSIKWDVEDAAAKFGGAGESDPNALLGAEICVIRLKDGWKDIEFFAAPDANVMDQNSRIRDFCAKHGVKSFSGDFTLSRGKRHALSCSQSTCFDELEKKGLLPDWGQKPGLA